MFIEKANVELLVSAGLRLKLNLFAQRILVVGPLPQHGAQHVQLVGKEQLCASVQFRPQDDVETRRGQNDQHQASQRVGRRQPERQGSARGAARPQALRLGFEDIAGTAHRVNQLYGEGIVHLAAQPAHVYIHDVGIAVEVHIPDRFGDQRAR